MEPTLALRLTAIIALTFGTNCNGGDLLWLTSAENHRRVCRGANAVGINVEYDRSGASFIGPWENATIQNQLVNGRGCNINTKPCLCYSYWSNYSVVFLCMSALERMPAHGDLLDMHLSKMLCRSFYPLLPHLPLAAAPYHRRRCRLGFVLRVQIKAVKMSWSHH